MMHGISKCGRLVHLARAAAAVAFSCMCKGTAGLEQRGDIYRQGATILFGQQQQQQHGQRQHG
jgi:hypothetical protein